MRATMLFLVLVVLPASACKSKYFNKRSEGDKRSAQAGDTTLSEDDEEAAARPNVPETEFVIADLPTLPLEGVVQRRPDGGIDVAGAIGGIWDKSVSPVYVTADTVVGPDKLLYVKPGVTVIFQGKYGISIEGGQLKVAGTASDPVTFTARDKTEGWEGIRFCPDAECKQEESRGRVEVRFATFEWARKDNMDPNDNTWRRGGVFYIRGTLTALIEDCTFNDNYAQERGGALEIIADNRNVIFRRNTLNRNRNDAGSSGGGGALHITHGRNLTIENNKFIENQSKAEGGAIYLLDSAGIVIKDNTFRNNTAALPGGAIRCDGHANLITIDASNIMSGNLPNDVTCDP